MLFKWKFSNSSATNDTKLMKKTSKTSIHSCCRVLLLRIMQCPGFANGFLFEIISLSVLRGDAIYVEIFNTMR